MCRASVAGNVLKILILLVFEEYEPIFLDMNRDSLHELRAHFGRSSVSDGYLTRQ